MSMATTARTRWFGFICCGLAIVGISAAVTTILGPLASPAVGGTCGPGKSSEPAVTAFVDPGSIGAGKEPSTANLEARLNWLAFVGECQASADGQTLLGGITVVPAAVFGIVGLLALTERWPRRRGSRAASALTPAQSLGDPWSPASPPGSGPLAAQPPPS
jgi:hypothetical protein